MKKGYEVEVIRRDESGRGIGSKSFYYNTLDDAKEEMRGIFKKMFCILYEWAQYESGLGDYKVELERQNL